MTHNALPRPTDPTIPWVRVTSPPEWAGAPPTPTRDGLVVASVGEAGMLSHAIEFAWQNARNAVVALDGKQPGAPSRAAAARMLVAEYMRPLAQVFLYRPGKKAFWGTPDTVAKAWVLWQVAPWPLPRLLEAQTQGLPCELFVPADFRGGVGESDLPVAVRELKLWLHDWLGKRGIPAIVQAVPQGRKPFKWGFDVAVADPQAVTDLPNAPCGLSVRVRRLRKNP